MAVSPEERQTGQCTTVPWNTKLAISVMHPQINKDDMDFRKCREHLQALKQNEIERLYPPNFFDRSSEDIGWTPSPTVLRIEVSVVGSTVRFSIDVAVPLMQGLLWNLSSPCIQSLLCNKHHQIIIFWGVILYSLTAHQLWSILLIVSSKLDHSSAIVLQYCCVCVCVCACVFNLFVGKAGDVQHT